MLRSTFALLALLTTPSIGLRLPSPLHVVHEAQKSLVTAACAATLLASSDPALAAPSLRDAIVGMPLRASTTVRTSSSAHARTPRA